MREIVRRAVQGRPELTAELLWRGMFDPDEKAELLHCRPECREEQRSAKLGSVQFATLLAYCDAQLATRAVLRGVLDSVVLRWLDRLLKLPRRNSKRDELVRSIERAMEGRKGNVRRHR